MHRTLLGLTLLALLLGSVSRAEDLSKIEWVTNMDDPPIGDINAKKGGTFETYLRAYPLTFRLVGPDATNSFAGWNRSYTMDFLLVRRHPTTDNWIPWMATHWSIQDDRKTIYYKLDPDARWSDGKKITAEDYVYTSIVNPDVYVVEGYNPGIMTQNFAQQMTDEEITGLVTWLLDQSQ